MSLEPNAQSSYPPLPGETIGFRAMLRRGWFDARNQQVLPGAFIRRPAPNDPDGLSVGIFCPVDDYLKGFRETFGHAMVHVEYVRELGLDVIQDEPRHASIVGAPYREDDPERAETLANQLARKANQLAKDSASMNTSNSA